MRVIEETREKVEPIKFHDLQAGKLYRGLNKAGELYLCAHIWKEFHPRLIRLNDTGVVHRNTVAPYICGLLAFDFEEVTTPVTILPNE